MAGLARPTLRCLREDLALAVPRADTQMEEISHPLLAKATERFADDRTPHERIAAIDYEGCSRSKPSAGEAPSGSMPGSRGWLPPGGGKRDHPRISTPPWQPAAKRQERATTLSTPRR